MDCATRTERPTALFSEPNRIFLELPDGKVSKDGRVTVQKRQKLMGSPYYAMRRILTTKQIGSDHGRHCSQWRKAMVEIGKDCLEPTEYAQALLKADRVFFLAKWVDPKIVVEQFCYASIKEGLSGTPKSHYLDDEVIMKCLESDVILPLLKEDHPSYQSMQRSAVDNLMQKGHGLKELTFKDLDTVSKLIQVLRTKGPLMVHGYFGAMFYGRGSISLEKRIGENDLYGWPCGTPQTKMRYSHAILLVGAEIKNQAQYVYWIDPSYDGNRTHVSSFKYIVDRMAGLKGSYPEEINPFARPATVCAVYNPEFTPL